MDEPLTAPCILWRGASNGRYGVTRVPGAERKMYYVHRLALEAKLGRPLGPGMEACHHCDTPLCIEPEHLFEGTRRDNAHDAQAKGRLARPPEDLWRYRGERNAHAKLTWDDVRVIRSLNGPSISSLARAFGVSRDAIRAVISGRHWIEYP